MPFHPLVQCSSPRMLALAFALIAAAPALALGHGTSARGWAFADGGVGRTETETLQAEADRYSLWIITAARGSGAYLADVEVSISDETGTVVFEHRLDGPWLMINLPPGRFKVSAHAGQETQKRITTIHARDHHQMVFYFDVQADVLPMSSTEQ